MQHRIGVETVVRGVEDLLFVGVQECCGIFVGLGGGAVDNLVGDAYHRVEVRDVTVARAPS